MEIFRVGIGRLSIPKLGTNSEIDCISYSGIGWFLHVQELFGFHVLGMIEFHTHGLVGFKYLCCL